MINLFTPDLVRAEFDAISRQERRSWGQVRTFLNTFELTGLWRNEAESFTEWLARNALTLHYSESTLWRYLTVGRYYNKLRPKLLVRNVDAPALEELTAGLVEVLHRGQRVASHARSYDPGKTTDPAHMETAHRHFAQWDMGQELDWALSVGPSTHAFLQVALSKAPHRDFSYRWANSIKSLSREYGDERLEAACKRALDIGATETRNLRSILKSKLDQQVVNQPTTQEANFEHDNIRGADYYH